MFFVGANVIRVGTPFKCKSFITSSTSCALLDSALRYLLFNFFAKTKLLFANSKQTLKTDCLVV